MSDIRYEVTKKMAVLSANERTGWTKEVKKGRAFNMAEVKGYKVFRPDWTCSPNGNTKQYTCPGVFEEDVTPVRCGHGMHFCRRAADCFHYYTFDPNNHVAEVIALGDIAEEGDKACTNKLQIVREVPWSEVLEIVNSGKACTGLCNTGDWNSGNRNTGDCNTGNRNTGDWNTGNRNSGSYNTGDWNATSFSNGCFNTEEPEIFMFNKPSGITYRQWLSMHARYLLEQIPGRAVVWIFSDDMTDEEKAAHPEHETTGGYLKKLDEPGNAQIWWDGLNEHDRNTIKALPNFDAVIFEKCTGIKIGG